MTRSRWTVNVRALLTDGAADDLDELRDELAIAAAAVPVQYGAEPETQDERERRDRVMSAAERNYWQARRGQVERLPFAGPVQALRALDAVRLDGPPLRTCWRVGEDSSGCAQTQPEGDAGQRDVERVAFVARAWEAVLADGWTLSTYPTLVALSAVQARCVVAWAVLGLPRETTPQYAKNTERTRTGDGNRAPSKHALGQRLQSSWANSPAEVGEAASAAFGVSVPAGHVVAIRVAGLAGLYVELYERGQVPLSSEWERASMERIQAPWSYEGWDSIATALGKSVDWAQRKAKRDSDPMPVRAIDGRICARRSDIEAWLGREWERAAKKSSASDEDGA